MKKLFKVLFILLLAGCAVYFFYSERTVFRLKGKFSRENPQVYVKPVFRKIQPQRFDNIKIKKFSYGVLEFKAPWGSPVKTLKKKIAYIYPENEPFSLVLTFAGQKSLGIFENNFPRKELNNQKKFFGEKICQSQYAFNKHIYYSMPEQLSFFKLPKENVKTGILLISKSAALSSGFLDYAARHGEFYNFEEKNIRGFQFGSPEKTDKVILDIFDNRDNSYFVWLKGKGITQDEIDFILSSIKILEPSSP